MSAIRAVALIAFSLLIHACSDTGAVEDNSGWSPLFEDQSLNGWHVVGDTGRYYFDGDVLVAEIIPEGGSYLVTDALFDDFILETDVRIDTAVNSGIQIRGSQLERDTTISFLNGRMERSERTFEAGRATGYQIEVDPSDRAWTGGLYEPSLRGWLVPLTGRDSAQAAFDRQEWNSLRVLAHGDTIRTWVNDVLIADTMDAAHRTGWIGLQAHAANSPEHVGKKVWWRNVRIRSLE